MCGISDGEGPVKRTATISRWIVAYIRQGNNTNGYSSFAFYVFCLEHTTGVDWEGNHNPMRRSVSLLDKMEPFLASE